LERVYVWTEALGCGEILPPMLRSFLRHHDVSINVFIYEEDLHYISEFDGVTPIVINDTIQSLVKKSALMAAFSEGHKGTALLWSHIIEANKDALLIHLDADTIFLGEVVSKILNGLTEAGVTGTRRPYRQTNSRNYLRKLHLLARPDAVNTHAFGFRNKIGSLSREEVFDLIFVNNRTLFQKIFNPVLDFFDPMTFHIRSISGIHYIDSKNQRKSGKYSRYGKFESSMISFAAVGSGCNFYKNPHTKTSDGYRQFALSSFSLYSKYLLSNEIEVIPLDSPYLVNLLDRLDVNTWTLKEF